MFQGKLIAYTLSVDDIDGVRRRNAEEQLQELHIEWKYVQGVRPNDVDCGSEYSPRLNRILQKRSLTPTEVCVYAGHRRAWRALLDSDHTYALVLEDDFKILDLGRFTGAIEDILSASEPHSLFKLFDFKPKRELAERTIGTSRWVMHKYAASGAVAYIIHRETAARLLARASFFRPVDEDFSHPWEFGIEIWSLTPNAVAEISGSLDGSLLEADRRTAKARQTLVRSVNGNLLQAYKLAAATLHFKRIQRRLAGKRAAR